MKKMRLRVTVIDMQPITPAVGGGRQRLLGLYHALGPNIECTYVGSYDWPGEPRRVQQLTPGLREIVVPLSAEHHAAADALKAHLDGRTVIDLAFADQVHLSTDYLRVAREHAAEADVVVFSHPWAYPAICDVLNAEQLVVYDSHNVEAVLRLTLHGDLPAAAQLLRRVAEIEYRICSEADLILACSHEDRETFARVYDADWSKLRVAPNGIFAFTQDLPLAEQRAESKRALHVDQAQLVIFMGSNYGPNNAAAAYVSDQLARALPYAAFAIMGGCCDSLDMSSVAPNVTLLGTLDEAQKHAWMRAADVAVNPLMAGSGTSIKMFDFMAAGLPTVTTEIGARGITFTGTPPFAVVDIESFATIVGELVANADERKAYAERGRKTVEHFYAWERISPALGRFLTCRHRRRQMQKPCFTVVIPTYERHQLLDRLMMKLEAQGEQDFEVIIIDQSATQWPNMNKPRRFPLQYVRNDIKGAVAARNLGGYLASGRIIAFTDDDCEPLPDWLANARSWFENPSIVGIEGIIRSDHLGDSDWRPVTNVGFEGIGFMTANLMVRNEAFQKLNGFDAAFDQPHFREDTDFGWRLQQLGEVPYADNTEVFHPAQQRNNQRESLVERNRFFEKDALLLKKHPEKYQQLFFMEAHFRQTVGFWSNLYRGLDIYGVDPPAWMKELSKTWSGAEEIG